jgi:hypothetical protein
MRLTLILAVLFLTSCSRPQKTGQEIRLLVQVVSIEPYRATPERQFIVTHPHKNLVGLRLTVKHAALPEMPGSVVYLAVDDQFLEPETETSFGSDGMSSNTFQIQVGMKGEIVLTEYNGTSGKFWDAHFDCIVTTGSPPINESGQAY